MLQEAQEAPCPQVQAHQGVEEDLCPQGMSLVKWGARVGEGDRVLSTHPLSPRCTILVGVLY